MHYDCIFCVRVPSLTGCSWAAEWKWTRLAGRYSGYCRSGTATKWRGSSSSSSPKCELRPRLVSPDNRARKVRVRREERLVKLPSVSLYPALRWQGAAGPASDENGREYSLGYLDPPRERSALPSGFLAFGNQPSRPRRLGQCAYFQPRDHEWSGRWCK